LKPDQTAEIARVVKHAAVELPDPHNAAVEFGAFFDS
jgi:hypothetical protein